MNQLVIAEKNSVAQAIAAVLSVKERKDGFIEGNGYIITWCVGHLIGLASADSYDGKYARWRYQDLPIIPATWKHTVVKDKKKQLGIISELMKREDVDTVICATDAGREGELIFRLVYGYCRCKKPIKRLWISSMEESAIAEGFGSLKDGSAYDNLYHAALCRSQADWLVGINATRLFSVLYGDTLNVGRVQTPTLALLVKRDADIRSFIKEPFYTVELELSPSDGNTFTASSEKMKDKHTAESIRVLCDGKNAVVQSIRNQKKTLLPPRLYDLTTLQREANRLLGFTSHETLEYSQSLYERKLITYPRTDSRFLTGDMAAGLPALVGAVAGALPFTDTLEPSVDVRRVVDNSKVTDHHAIIPTMTMTKADLTKLPPGEREILYMVAVRLICAVGEKHEFSETTVTLDCEKYIFTAKGKTILYNGWKDIEQLYKAAHKNKRKDESEDDKEQPAETRLPELTEGQIIENVRAGLHEGFTSPPKPFAEDTLLAAMESAGAEDMPEDAERKGLGTPATRAGIIEKLIKSGFVNRVKKQLFPTEKGINLITVVPDIVKSPSLTAEWEHRLKRVERGEMQDTAFMIGIAELTDSLVKTHSSAKEEFRPLFNAPRPKPVNQGKSIGTCPRCGGNIREGKPGFFCDNTSCGFALWKENKFFSSKKKTLDAQTAAALIKDKRVFIAGLYSERTGKTYDATVILNDTGGKYVNFGLDFSKVET